MQVHRAVCLFGVYVAVFASTHCDYRREGRPGWVDIAKQWMQLWRTGWSEAWCCVARPPFDDADDEAAILPTAGCLRAPFWAHGPPRGCCLPGRASLTGRLLAGAVTPGPEAWLLLDTVFVASMTPFIKRRPPSPPPLSVPPAAVETGGDRVDPAAPRLCLAWGGLKPKPWRGAAGCGTGRPWSAAAEDVWLEDVVVVVVRLSLLDLQLASSIKQHLTDHADYTPRPTVWHDGQLTVAWVAGSLYDQIKCVVRSLAERRWTERMCIQSCVLRLIQPFVRPAVLHASCHTIPQPTVSANSAGQKGGRKLLQFNFWSVGKFSSRRKNFFRKTKFGNKNPPFWIISGGIKFLNTHNLVCRKFAVICPKL